MTPHNAVVGITVEMYGGPLDGCEWPSDGVVAESGTVTYKPDAGGRSVVMDAVPSSTRDDVVLALWATRRVVQA